MAPDLNSVPPSPRPRDPSTTTTATSGSAVTEPYHQPSSISSSARRDSHLSNMGPPPAPHDDASPSMGNAIQSAVDNAGVGNGPGPLRHPRPLTIAEVHLELEKEQEAVVNRLTRELSHLRQQTASVASTASSTSTNLHEHTDLLAQPGLSDPLPARNRSSSTLSSRSMAGNTAGAIPILAPRNGGIALPSRPSLDRQQNSFSREAPSGPSHHPTETMSPPSLSSSLHQHGEHFPNTPSRSHSHAHRSSASSIPPLTIAGRPLSPAQPEHLRPNHTSSPQPQPPSRYEEVTHHRAELEAVKRENEALRRRVRCLESTVRQHRRHERTASVTTTSSIASGPRDAEVTDPQETEIIPDRIS